MGWQNPHNIDGRQVRCTCGHTCTRDEWRTHWKDNPKTCGDFKTLKRDMTKMYVRDLCFLQNDADNQHATCSNNEYGVKNTTSRVKEVFKRIKGPFGSRYCFSGKDFAYFFGENLYATDKEFLPVMTYEELGLDAPAAPPCAPPVNNPQEGANATPDAPGPAAVLNNAQELANATPVRYEKSVPIM